MKPHRIALTIGGVATGLQAVWAVTQVGGEKATMIANDAFCIAVTLAATIACVFRSRTETSVRARRAWMWLAAAVGAWFVGGLFWSYFELRGLEPFPSLADVGYLAVYPFAAIGLLRLPGAPAQLRTRVRTLLDAVLTASGLFFIAWAMFLGDAMSVATGPALAKALGMAYPIGDVLIVTLAVMASRREPGRNHGTYAYIWSGFTFLALADSGFLFLVQHGMYERFRVIDAIWTGAFMLIGVGALKRPASGVVEVAAETPYQRRIILVSIPILGVLASSVYAESSGGPPGSVLLWTGIVIGLAIFGRQVLLYQEGRGWSRRLEDIVDERTRELREALERVSRAQKQQNEFIANASHELRTPLTTILGAVETLHRRDLGLSEEAQTLVRMAERGTQRMTRLVEDLLFASGIAGAIAVELESVDVASVMRRAVAAVYLPSRAVRIEVEDGLVVHADEDRMQLVLGHLLSNADKFSPDDAPISLRAVHRGSRVAITITDQGCGVPEHLREHVFEPFVQGDGSSTRRHGGVGLGLYIARQLARAMGGDIHFTTPPHGHGTTVRLDLAADKSGTSVSAQTWHPFWQEGVTPALSTG